MSDYDELEPDQQAAVRAAWAGAMDVKREMLDLAQEFSAAGRWYVELDDDGNVVRREPAADVNRARG